jgi:hypothetical protein
LAAPKRGCFQKKLFISVKEKKCALDMQLPRHTRDTCKILYYLLQR